MKKYNDVHISFTISREYLKDLEEVAAGLHLSKGQASRQLVEAYCRRRRKTLIKEMEYMKKLAQLNKDYGKDED